MEVMAAHLKFSEFGSNAQSLASWLHACDSAGKKSPKYAPAWIMSPLSQLDDINRIVSGS
jgi:hypothetical protein